MRRLILALLVFSSFASSQTTEWPMFRGDYQSTGFAEISLDANTIQPFLKTSIGTCYAHAVVKDGVVYIGSQLNKLFAIDSDTGSVLWQFTLPNTSGGDYRDVKSAVAISDSTVIVNSWDKTVFGLNIINGALKWTFESPFPLHSDAHRGFFINPSPKAIDGIIYIGLADARFHAIQASTGQELWSYPVDNLIVSSPAFYGEIVYFASGRMSSQGTLYAVNIKTAQLVWNKPLLHAGISSPVVKDGTVFYGNLSTLYVLNPLTGNELWKINIPSGNYIEGTPLISGSSAYVCGGDWSIDPPTGSIYCFDLITKQLKWEKPGYFVRQSPVLPLDVLLVGEYRNASGDKSDLLALDSGTGKTLWQYQTNYVITGIPAVVKNRIFLGCGDGYLRSFSFESKVANEKPSMAHAMGDLDGDGTEEIAVDFGNLGIWKWDAGSWSRIRRENSKGMIALDLDGDGTDEIAMNLGIFGLWLWDMGIMTELDPNEPEYMIAVDTNNNNKEEIILDQGSLGLKWRQEDGHMFGMTGMNAQNVVAADIDGDWGDEVVADFGGLGIWLFDNGVWTNWSTADPNIMIRLDVNGDGTDGVAFGLIGLGTWIRSDNSWMQISGVLPESLLANKSDSTGAEKAIADYGSLGLWQWDGSTWSQLTGVNPEKMISSDIDGDGTEELIVDFGAFGLWLLDNGNWGLLSSANPENLLFGDIDGDLKQEVFVDFGSLGLWLWNEGNWSQLTWINPDPELKKG